MKNPITTKDLSILNELMIFEQWASTSFRQHYDCLSEDSLKDLFEDICLEHSERFDALFDYLKTNSKANEKLETQNPKKNSKEAK